MVKYLKRYSVVLIAALIIVIVCVKYLNSYKKNDYALPDKDYYCGGYDNIYEYELDDYYLRYDLESDKYIITDKETGKSREVFNAPNKDRAFVTDIYIDKNLIYYGNEYGFFSYDVGKDITTEIYKHENRSTKITVFGVCVYFKPLSWDDRTTYPSRYLISDGKLIVITNQNIFEYKDGKKKILVTGDYSLQEYKDGVMTLSRKYFDENGEEKSIILKYNIRKGSVE